ncbi:DUF3564 family protein [Paraburkholderia sp. SARCC-3016]|jgi:hypothetical protein|uniref:DUF3564 family protein n=1 Tax=Paraburkholderia sp. SARCC-3016 TaxID=3058611 RepID=UPI0028074101|nr:DUF3564 family protein [Paraburkholderia sp. SARCC-3016]MDQ7976991.1 DUF3564 family protein [Paraburkholderia sp. SARCC-3016]
MRLSILINTPDPTAGHDYAVLWLDTENRGWALDARRGIELPAAGEVRDSDGVLALCEHGCDEPFVTLYGMRVDRRGNVASAQGRARWTSSGVRHGPVDGYWRLRAVERPATAAHLPPAGQRPATHVAEPGRPRGR